MRYNTIATHGIVTNIKSLAKVLNFFLRFHECHRIYSPASLVRLARDSCKVLANFSRTGLARQSVFVSHRCNQGHHPLRLMSEFG